MMSSCGRPEDPARTALRARLKQDTRLSGGELKRLLDEVGLTIAGRTFRLKQGDATQALNEEQRDVVFGMLINSAGVFDEGLRSQDGGTFRVLNAPGKPLSSEIEGTRRLWVDVETLVPRRFEFAYAVPGFGDYSFDLLPER